MAAGSNVVPFSSTAAGSNVVPFTTLVPTSIQTNEYATHESGRISILSV
jgi:hypothetical protein